MNQTDVDGAGRGDSISRAVSWDGSILQFDGTTWQRKRDPTWSDLHGIWGTSASDVYTVGQGLALHYDGTSWKDISTGITRNVEAIWGTSGSDVYAGGVDGNVFHYDGTLWTRIAFDAPISISQAPLAARATCRRGF